MLEDENIDAIHLNSPIQEHADQTVKVLDAGKHVACTVPMATSIEDCWRIVDAQQRSGRTYMMMETAVYTREFLYARSLLDKGGPGTHPIPTRCTHARDGWLARLLARTSTHALRDARCRAAACTRGCRSRVCDLRWLR
jgi:predicted dehydrogenase